MQDKKCVVLVVSSLRMGGAEKVASFLANALADDYKVVLVLWSKENQFYTLDSRVQVEIVPNVYRGIFGNINRIKGLIRIFKVHQASLAISFIHQSNILAILAGKISKIPVIATEHSIYSGLNSKIWNLLRRLTYPFAKCVTTLTHKDLQHYSFLSNVCVMSNPIALEKSESKDYLQYKPYVLSAGRMIKSKHYEELLRAFSIFSKTHKDYSLLLAGDGEERERLEKQAKELGIKAVFLGRLENLYSLYCNAEFFALASYKEGLSNVLIESLMCGTPVVSYDCPYGPSEIIKHGENGYLVELGNVESLAEHFEKITSNRVTLAQNTKYIESRFGEEVVLEKWKALIQKFIV
ncbi:glycosyltransferase family 4 protein [Helicobacter sp. MIT 11-5569]|uniref:glycosyltransferase n=1 Tax=Helicobacter sp. MIT 11-5569 TaxID=1548151 RepID=UPI00051FEAE1|nr:glycosyltransferase [Helicobacter sp. MIT 11-5569]TLD79881.1 glycosyltransferase family 4 protein [Helicobacter sp. MIT 11-5569]